MTPVTFGAAKPRLALAFGGAQGVTDARVLEYCNRAQSAIIEGLASISPDGKPWTPRGIYVGGVDQLTLTVTGGQLVTLPSTHETVLEVEIVNAQDINNGWYSGLDMTGLVDPDFAQDVVAIRQGLDGDGKALYFIPSATVGNTVKVMAKKRFVPVTADGDLLCVPNVKAVVAMLIAIQKEERNDNPDDAEKFRIKALRGMAGELNGYLADPTNTLLRKQAYLNDEKTYAANTLGYVRARLALDLPNALKVGKTNLTRGVNRIVERLVQRTNELRTAGRLRVKTGLANLTFHRAIAPTDVLDIADYEQIRAMAMAFLSMSSPTPDVAMADAQEKRAYDLLEAEETNALETLRHTTYANALQTGIASGQTNTLGYFIGKLALELPDGLKASDVELRRGVNEAVREALQQRNALTATELYSNTDGPDIVPFTYSQNDTDVLPYADFEVIRLLFMAQSSPDAPALKQAATAQIEENVQKAAKATRFAKWECLIKLPRFTYGWMRAKVGLGLSERGFTFSDAKVGRMVNDAEDSLCRTPNFKNGEGAYSLVADENGIVTLPLDAERIIYADVCGIPLSTKHRSFEYIPIPSGYGVQPNFFATFANWGFNGPFGYRGQAALQDRGFNTNGNRIYYMQGCWLTNLGTVDSTSSGTNVNVVVKRKYLPKVADGDVMLVQNVEAIRCRVEAEIARLDNRLSDAGALQSAAATAMDETLLNEKAGEVIVPKFTMVGRGRRGGVQTLYRGR